MISKVLIVAPPLVHGDEKSDPLPHRPDIETYRLVSPIEPLTVLSNLRGRGFVVQFIDLGTCTSKRWEVVEQALSDFQPHAVVIIQSILTFATAQDWNGRQVFERARRQNSEVVTILTGGHATNYPGQAVQQNVCDISIRGEVDFIVGDVLEALNRQDTLSQLPGVSYRQEQHVQVSADYPFVSVDDLPLPAYDALSQEQRTAYESILEFGKIRFPAKSRKYRDIMTSRSCPLRCTFCSVAPLRGSKQKYRKKPLHMVMKEIEIALEEGIEEIHFFDDLFAESEEQIFTFTNELARRNLKFPWFVGQGMPLWPLTLDALTAMKATGMYRLICPVESGSDRVLRRVIGKSFSTVDHHHNVVSWARALDLEIIGMFVVGLPGESRKEILDTVSFAETHPEIDYSVFSIATPMVGTRLMKQVMKNGQLKDSQIINRVIKRTVSLYRTEAFNEYEMGVIRTFDWDRINFSTLERRKRYARMVGLTLKQLDQLRAHSKETFFSFFPDFQGPYSFKELFEVPGLYRIVEPRIA